MTCGACRSTRVYGVEVQGVYDGVLYFQCGACDAMWHRFPRGAGSDRLHELAQTHMERAVARSYGAKIIIDGGSE